MCLSITPSGAALAVCLRSSKAPIKVWKALSPDGTTYYKGAPWNRTGVNCAEGTLPALGAATVEGGAFHAFRTEKDARAWAKKRSYGSPKIVAAYVLPPDVVAVGRFERGATESICATAMYGSLRAARVAYKARGY